MRKLVTPADAAATILDPDRGTKLPPEGRPVNWTPYWAALEAREDIIALDLDDEDNLVPPSDPPPPEPAKPKGAARA